MMLLQRLLVFLRQNAVEGIFNHFAICPVATNLLDREAKVKSLLEKILDDGLLWAVPKKRRSLERRLKRKHGSTYIRKYATPKRNLVACWQCGHWHEMHCICPKCYEKVQLETKALQEKMDDSLRYGSIDKEIAVVYKGEQIENADQFQLFEFHDRDRPQWFARNLLTPRFKQIPSSQTTKSTE